MRIIFQLKLLRGGNKIHWNNEGVDNSTIFYNSSHARHATLILVNIFLFEWIGYKNNTGVLLQ